MSFECNNERLTDWSLSRYGRVQGFFHLHKETNTSFVDNQFIILMQYIGSCELSQKPLYNSHKIIVQNIILLPCIGTNAFYRWSKCREFFLCVKGYRLPENGSWMFLGAPLEIEGWVWSLSAYLFRKNCMVFKWVKSKKRLAHSLWNFDWVFEDVILRSQRAGNHWADLLGRPKSDVDCGLQFGYIVWLSTRCRHNALRLEIFVDLHRKSVDWDEDKCGNQK